MKLSSYGSFLGAVSFVILAAIGIHQKLEVDWVNAHQPPTLEQLADNVVALEMESGAICSGWISKADGKIHTAAHCFEFVNAPQPVTVHFQDNTTEVWNTSSVNTTAGDYAHDFATLVPGPGPHTHHPGGLPVCTFKPYYGEFTALMGAPFGIAQSMTFGWVQKPSDNGMIVIDTKQLPGNSGGPLIDTEEGCVLGQSELTFNNGTDDLYGVHYVAPVWVVAQ